VITLITGVPGAGKTLNPLKLVDQEIEKHRPIYYCGIRECKMPGWVEISYEDSKRWQEYEEGSVFVIDECDRFAGNSPDERKKHPEYISELARHRHRGMDFYFITQKSTMFHHLARNHIGRHLHFERPFGRPASRRVEFQKCQDDTDDHRARKGAVITRHPFPTEYYDKYRSAEVHTHKQRIPFKVWASLGAVVLMLGGLTYAGFRIANYEERVLENADAGVKNLESEMFAYDEETGFTFGSRSPGDYQSAEEFAYTQTPRLQDLPWSAPAYDEIREVKSMPRPQCVYFHRTGKCKCFTQQASPLEVSYAQCRNIVDNGYFNPYIEDRALAARGPEGRDSPGPGRADPVPQDPQPPGPSVYSDNPEELEVTPSYTSNQPGRAYRGQVSSVAVRPGQPGVGSRPFNPTP